MDIEIINYTVLVLLFLMFFGKRMFKEPLIGEFKRVYDLSIGDVRCINNSPFGSTTSKVIDIQDGWVEYSFILNDYIKGFVSESRESCTIDEYLRVFKFKVEAK